MKVSLFLPAVAAYLVSVCTVLLGAPSRVALDLGLVSISAAWLLLLIAKLRATR